jgi:hypothetical protein
MLRMAGISAANLGDLQCSRAAAAAAKTLLLVLYTDTMRRRTDALNIRPLLLAVAAGPVDNQNPPLQRMIMLHFMAAALVARMTIGSVDIQVSNDNCTPAQRVYLVP